MACTQYIPMMAGQSSMLNAEEILSGLLGQVGYEVVGNKIVFTRDITIDGKNAVTLRLLVTDINALGDYDPLPVPADMEAALIDSIYKSFLPVEQQPRVVDNYSSNNQPAKQ